MDKKEVTEYKIEFIDKKDRTYTHETENPKEAGITYKDVRKQLEKGESVEITKRVVTYGPWETIEKETR